MCKPLLKKCGYSQDEIERISGIIRTHSTDDPLAPETIEGKVLFDADKLDATGPVALHRFFFEYQKRGFLHHDAARKTIEHINRWKQKYGSEIFFTKSARKIGKERIKYLTSKCQEILDDLEKFKDVYEHLE